MRRVLFLLLFMVLVVPSSVLATKGVGIGNDKIEVDEPLKAGSIYQVPAITVINTGDEASNYEVGITYHSDWPIESWPPEEWFEFSPKEFYIEPGGTQVVEIQLNIPIKVVPGEYKAYLEGRPILKDASGGAVQIQVAAASRMTFSIAPANIFQGLYYRVVALFANNAPWSYIVLAVIVLAILAVLFKSKFKFNLSIDKK